ncbi:TRAFAC clade GTPase domain-containing protein [Nitrosopumilus sp.]|uniref:TRAFAC clade GTPase domain-containing protein n=1 Tax=Nitrosopumilus sp. TaxID=2024843 RepID=UPI003D152229
MAKENLNDILESAREHFDENNTVAFIGKSNYGKTVVSTMLFDTLSTEFLKKYRKKFHVRILDGYDEIDRTHRRMFSKGRFPPPTLPNTKSRLKIEISSRGQLGTKAEYMLRDASGEDIQEILQKRYDNPKSLVETILTKYKSSGDLFGPLSYLLFAKIYVILIDSKESPEWRTEQVRYSQIINAILDMKKYIGETVDEKISNPIALVFTKTDELKKSSTKESSLSNEEFLESNLPLFESTLQSTHSGNLSIFMFSIDGVTEASPEEAEEIIKEEMNELKELNAEYVQKKLEQAERERKDKINAHVKNAMNKAREEATAEGQPPDVIEARAREAGKAERAVAENENKIELDPDDSTVELDSEDKTRYKITLPVKYSQREYIRFISWLIDNNS